MHRTEPSYRLIGRISSGSIKTGSHEGNRTDRLNEYLSTHTEHTENLPILEGGTSAHRRSCGAHLEMAAQSFEPDGRHLQRGSVMISNTYTDCQSKRRKATKQPHTSTAKWQHPCQTIADLTIPRPCLVSVAIRTLCSDDFEAAGPILLHPTTMDQGALSDVLTNEGLPLVECCIWK